MAINEVTPKNQKNDQRQKAGKMNNELMIGLEGQPLGFTEAFLAAASTTILSEASRLSDVRLQIAQRQALAAQIGALHGNNHLQRVLASREANHVANSLEFRRFSDQHPSSLSTRQVVIQRDDGGAPGTAGTTTPATTSGDFSQINDAISTASTNFPHLEPLLRSVTVRARTMADRTDVQVDGTGNFSYPSTVIEAEKGFYLYQWDSNGNYSTSQLIDLETGLVAVVEPMINQKAGLRELLALRSNRIGVVQITQTVVKPATPPTPAPPRPEDLEFPLERYPEVLPDEIQRIRDTYPDRQMVIPGITGGIFEPGRTYSKPLNFIYYTHDGMQALVSRSLVGRDFFYVVPMSHIQDYLRFYPIEYAGLAAAGMATLAQLIVEIGLGFIPVVGPLWMLLMTARDVYHAYNNWDNMTGMEKTLVGLNVLLTAIPVVRAGKNIVRGTMAFREGVNTMVARGLPKADATRLMLAAGVFQSERATRHIVASLSDALMRGERLAAGEIAQIERILNMMVARLPAAERALLTATYATQSLGTARQFLEGVALTEKHLTGLRRLMPEVLVALKTAARTEPIVVERIALMAAKSEAIAKGIDNVALMVKPGHLTHVAAELGEDILEKIGSGALPVSEDLVNFVKRARSARDAYRRLMQGTTRGRAPVRGLAEVLEGIRPAGEIPPALAGISGEFSHTYLTVEQLSALSRLSPEVRAALKKASDSDLRAVANFANESSHAMTAANDLGTRLLAANLPGYALGPVLSEAGGGLLSSLGRSGASVSHELITEVARLAKAGKTTAAKNTLLRGFTSRAAGGGRIAGVLEVVAGGLSTRTAMETALQSVERIGSRAELFAQWAIMNLTMIDGVETIARLRPSDAQAKIAGIYRAFASSPDTVLDVFRSIKQIETKSTGVAGLDRMVGELAAGGTKTMGASLTLNYVVKRCGGEVVAFERRATAAGVTRDYDLVARGFEIEFKYWTGIGGEPLRAALNEFERDVILHVGSDFRSLKWVFSNNVSGGRLQLESYMRGVLSRPRVLEALRRQGISLAEAQSRLDTALAGWLIDFI